MNKLSLAAFALLTLAACDKGGGAGASPSASASASAAAAATSAAAAKPSAAAAAPASTVGVIGKCSVVGTWEGKYPPGPYPFSNTPITLTWNADGTGQSKSARADTELSWKVSGETFSFTGVKDDTNPGRFTCKKGDESTSKIEFSADCNTMTFHVQSDKCAPRKQQLDGQSAHRKTT
jgi:hypothetical protein